MLFSLFRNFFSWFYSTLSPSAFPVFSKSLECHLGACILELINVWWTLDEPFFPDGFPYSLKFWFLNFIDLRWKTVEKPMFLRILFQLRRWRWAALWWRECGKMDMDDVMQLRSMRQPWTKMTNKVIPCSPYWHVGHLRIFYIFWTYWCFRLLLKHVKKNQATAYASPGICQRGGASDCCCGGIARSSENSVKLLLQLFDATCICI